MGGEARPTAAPPTSKKVRCGPGQVGFSLPSGKYSFRTTRIFVFSTHFLVVDRAGEDEDVIKMLVDVGGEDEDVIMILVDVGGGPTRGGCGDLPCCHCWFFSRAVQSGCGAFPSFLYSDTREF
jgi:hypothetical protein